MCEGSHSSCGGALKSSLFEFVRKGSFPSESGGVPREGGKEKDWDGQ